MPMITLQLAVVLAASIFATSLDACAERQHREVFDPPEPEDHKYNVQAYGAVGNGNHNDTDAFLKAIRAASQAADYSSVLVPAGHYLVWPLLFEDCVNTWLEVEGTIIAPPNPLDWQQNTYFIHFHNPNNCSVVGRSPDAEIEGHGLAWWTRNESKEKKGPSLIVFSGKLSSYPQQPGVYNISLLNAPYAHVMAINTQMYNGPQVAHVTIRSQWHDHLASAGVVAVNASVFMEDLDIDVGGQNVGLYTGYGDDSRGFMRLEKSTMKRGLGILILMTDGIMGNISIENIDFDGTVWGLRAVGAKDGSGELVNVYCENFNMIQVGLPLLVSNVFCPVSHEGCTRPAKGVGITSIAMETVSATQSVGMAGEFYGTDAKPCHVSLSNIDIRPTAPGVANEFHCIDATGWTSGTISPKSCLKEQGLSASKPWQDD